MFTVKTKEDKNMKKNSFYAVALLTAVLFASCSGGDEHYDVIGNPNTLVYIDQTAPKTFTCNVLHTPIGSFGEIKAEFPVRIQYAAEAEVTIGAEADMSYVDAYNKKYGTEYVALPESVVKTMNVKTAVIETNTYDSAEPVEVTIPEDDLDRLTAPVYLLPLRLTAVSSKQVTGSVDYGVGYIIIKTSDDYVSISGTNTVNTTIVRTPVGVFGEVSAKFNVSLAAALSKDMLVTLQVDNDAVAAYNAEKGSSYIALPTNVLNALSVTASKVKAGEKNAETAISVSVPKDMAQTLTEPAYLIPLRLVTGFGATPTETQDEYAYVTVETKESIMNGEPTSLLGKPATDRSAWICVSATGLKPEEMQNAFATGWSGGWSFNGDKLSSASFVVDLGASHNVSGFMFSSNVMTNARIYLSADNSTWTDCGELSGNNTVRDSNGNNWYVLYGAVPAKYVKVELTLDPNSWAWAYASYGYCTLKYNLAFED